MGNQLIFCIGLCALHAALSKQDTLWCWSNLFDFTLGSTMTTMSPLVFTGCELVKFLFPLDKLRTKEVIKVISNCLGFSLSYSVV